MYIIQNQIFELFIDKKNKIEMRWYINNHVINVVMIKYINQINVLEVYLGQWEIYGHISATTGTLIFTFTLGTQQ